MPRKKFDVVELNKTEKEIILEQKASRWKMFYLKYGKLIYLILLIISILSIITSLFLAVKMVGESSHPHVKEASVDIDGLQNMEISLSNINSFSSDYAVKNFFNEGSFSRYGEVLLVKKVEAGTYTIKYYSDGTALKIMKKDNFTTRIGPLKDGSYGISPDGVVNSKATILDVSIVSTKEIPWGLVTYYSDGSAMISNSKFDMFVRNSKDINEKYISNNKVSYLEKVENVGSYKLNYYYDGTVEVVSGGKTYVIRNEEDIKISGNSVSFPNNNEAREIDSKNLRDGNKVVYYSDGSAIIYEGSRKISVRKSNSIIIKDNKIFEIVDNKYVTVCDNRQNGKIKYYTNGSAILEYNGKTIYVPENSNIKYRDNKVVDVVDDYEFLNNKVESNGMVVSVFETVSLVDTDENMFFVPADSVIFNSDGSLREIDTEKIEPDGNSFVISNNTNNKLKYRVVIEKSDRTNLDVQYIRYQLKAKELYVEPSRLDKNLWEDDSLASDLSVKGTNYILYEGELEPLDSSTISLMLWTDYDTIPNSMQDKYFYGTIRVYAWINE